MKKLFDYIFYRWYNIYKSKDRDPNIYAAGMVLFYQLFTIINIVSITCILFGVDRPDKKYLLVPFIIFVVINYIRYENNFNISELDNLWKEEPYSPKRRNMILLMVYFIVMLVLPWIYGFATN